jgi:ubiquinone/menaquinone biosynthesis C-methylase UbiE
MPDSHKRTVQTEFERAAECFARRTAGRFDVLEVPSFARVQPGAVVAEVGAGTGNFLGLFSDIAARLIAVDLTPGMLAQARDRNGRIEAVVADGARLPLRSTSIDLIAIAQTLHHIWEPLVVLKEMRRTMKADGSLVIVDQVAPESYEQAAAMNELETIRDPSHAVSRPPSAFRILANSAGLEVVDLRLAEVTQRFSEWMWPDEFPPERIAAVQEFIERHGGRTGMSWKRVGDDWVYVRTRIMMLAKRAGGT